MLMGGDLHAILIYRIIDELLILVRKQNQALLNHMIPVIILRLLSSKLIDLVPSPKQQHHS